MSKSEHRFEVRNPEPEHFIPIQDLCKRVYPFTKPWSLGQLEAHHTYFPDGQLVIIEKSTDKVVGLAFSLIISWDDYSPQDNWLDFTSSGFFHNHNPKKGKTLYGAEVMVDPEYRGQGLGKMLYKARTEIARKYNLTRIRAGARLRGYSKYKDKYSPEEYVRRVYEKEIFDPTLSFQLNQGFVPLDVARNYLFNDPESLGYAAVIEWLNPEAAIERDFRRQKENVDFFLTHQRLVVEHLPKELRRLVRKVTFLLGQVIREQEGPRFFEKVENYRKMLKPMRSRKKKTDLDQLSKRLRRETSENRLKIAHGFSLLLELVNACEAAYRTWRQRQKTIYSQHSSQQLDLTFVLTAHPTEARSPLVIEFFRRISQLLIEGLENNFVFNDQEVSSLLRALISIPLVKTKAPTVFDEAEYIYSILFHQPTFDFILSQRDPYRIRLRTWVGGDKDGHPGVNDQVMSECLLRSRVHLIDQIDHKIRMVLQDLEKLSPHLAYSKDDRKSLQNLRLKLPTLKKIQVGDGKKVDTWKYSFFRVCERASTYVQMHHQIELIEKIFELFPGLVVPIELREDAGKIQEALKDRKAAISKMISKLSEISKGSTITYYARGLVISHCEQAKDINNAHLLCRKNGAKTFPIIPLFESRSSLSQAEQILTEWLGDKKNLSIVKDQWSKKLEVMLGYSDSAKQVGVLPSRALIKSSMNKVSKVAKKYQVTPVFFHGSGGSVARGGGSLREQISWWPSAAAKRPKLTIQGEMIQRTFATKEILHSQCLHFAREMKLRKPRRVKTKTPKAFTKFSQNIENHYQSFVSNSELLTTCLDATPYKYLEVLKIGSRPSKRPTQLASLDSLRAIPWVLCWTQSRVLLPTWYGVGSSWENLTGEEKEELKKHFEEDPFFSSFVKQLSFTLAKVELLVWQQYLCEFEPQKADQILKSFEKEYKKTIQFCFEISGKKSLLWHRPWLEESIKLRSPYIHILNLLQIVAMKKEDEKLLKETLVGIACGMLTTG